MYDSSALVGKLIGSLDCCAGVAALIIWCHSYARRIVANISFILEAFCIHNNCWRFVRPRTIPFERIRHNSWRVHDWAYFQGISLFSNVMLRVRFKFNILEKDLWLLRPVLLEWNGNEINKKLLLYMKFLLFSKGGGGVMRVIESKIAKAESHLSLIYVLWDLILKVGISRSRCSLNPLVKSCEKEWLLYHVFIINRFYGEKDQQHITICCLFIFIWVAFYDGGTTLRQHVDILYII